MFSDFVYTLMHEKQFFIETKKEKNLDLLQFVNNLLI